MNYSRHFLHFVLCGLLAAFANVCQGQNPEPLKIPAFSAYSEPDPEALHFSHRNNVANLSDAKQTLAWYGMVRTAGELDVAVEIELPKGERTQLQLKAAGKTLKAQVEGTGTPALVPFGRIRVGAPGPIKFGFVGRMKTGASYGDIKNLVLSGSATKDAVFNLTEQRGAPSVHLGFPTPEGKQAEWFYNEVTAKADPVATYYEACGFSRGYFGIQVNSPTERRIIFSVWDAGNEAVDRNKVVAENRVQLLAKGADVFAESFGNEGTGGHSHLVYPWKTGETYRFLVTAKAEGNSTVYTGYFYFPERAAWGLIASFRAPKDGGYLRGLYSFNEDFWGANGQMRRLAEFGNQWIKTVDGEWIELTKARFTHTARGRYKDRLDHYAGVNGNRFFLSSGGFLPETMEHGTFLDRPAAGQQPKDLSLPQISSGSPGK